MIKPRHAICVFLLAIPLMGMKCTASGKATCRSGGGCEGTGEVKGEWEWLRQIPLVEKLLSLDETLDAAAFAIDVSQSTVTVPVEGFVTVDLVDSATGLTQASRVFSWSRAGLQLKLSDPDTVNNWALQSGGTADTLEYRLHPFTTSEQEGWNTLVLTQVYDGDVQGSASSTWRGQQCPLAPIKSKSKSNVIYCP